MSANNSDSDDLTTDAVPSPPRNEVKEEKTLPLPNTQPKSHKPKSKTHARTRRHMPEAYASVININNANGVHIGSNYNVHFNSNNNGLNNVPKKEYVITETIKSLFERTESVTRDDLLCISPHLQSDHWRMTARKLNYSEGQISQFHADHHIPGGIKEVIYQLLLDWIQNEGPSATIGKLSNTLWETNQQDAVIRWAANINKINREM